MQYDKINTNITEMNLGIMKWAQCDNTQSRDALRKLATCPFTKFESRLQSLHGLSVSKTTH